MRIGIFDNFGALNSPPVFGAIRKGLDRIGVKHASHDMTADIGLIWSMLWAGRMKPNKEVCNHFMSQGKPVIVVEVGMFDRGVTWRLGIHTTHGVSYYGDDYEPSRVKNLSLRLQDWRRNGSSILIVAQRSDSHQWHGMPSPEEWVHKTIIELKNHTDRPIVVRPHPRQRMILPSDVSIVNPKLIRGTYDSFDFIESLNDVWAVVNWNSSPSCVSVIEGVTAFAGPNSLASLVANGDYSKIEDPEYPDRTQWLNHLSHTEWTIDEIATGYPLTRLLR